MKRSLLILLLSLFSFFIFAQPTDENYDDNAGQSFSANPFIIDGIKYTITGTGSYRNSVYNSSIFSPLGNDGADYYLLFDDLGAFGISSIKIEAVDGSAFKLNSLTMDVIADGNVTITPVIGPVPLANGPTPLTFVSEGSFITQSVNTSGNPDFQNITSFTFAGSNLSLALDDLDFSAALIVPLSMNCSATLQAGQAQIKWDACNESNVDKYIVENSPDGRSWAEVGFVNCKPNSPRNFYNYTDAHPLNGNTFYRIKILNKDGQYTLSNILRVQGQTIQVSFYPNPAKDYIVVSVPGTQKAIIQLFNSSGKKMFERTLQDNINTINVKQLPLGIYSIKIIRGNSIFVQQMIRK